MSTKERGPAVAKRQLRLILRQARLGADKTQAEVAEVLDWSPSKILRIENGQVAVQTSDLRALVTQYPSLTSQTEELVELARLSRQPTVASRYRDVLTKEFAEWLEYEAYAKSIRQFETEFVPGVLQTDEYATGIVNGLMGAGRNEDVAKRIVEARFERADPLMGRGGPRMEFIIDEGALYRWVGNEDGAQGYSTMVDQLRQLKTFNTVGRSLAGESIEKHLNPNVSIQIVPLTIGSYPALRGPFEIAEFEDEKWDSMMYFENREGDVVIKDNPDEIARHIDLFAELKKVVPTADSANSIIDQIALSRSIER